MGAVIILLCFALQAVAGRAIGRKGARSSWLRVAGLALLGATGIAIGITIGVFIPVAVTPEAVRQRAEGRMTMGPGINAMVGWFFSVVVGSVVALTSALLARRNARRRDAPEP